MSKRTHLLNGKPEGGFSGLAAVMLSFSMALAAFAAGGIVLAGCDSPAGVATGYNEAVFAETSAPAPESGGGAIAGSTVTKKIKVKFNVKNGGWGLIKSQGIVSKQDDSYLVSGSAGCADDFVIEITVPASENYLNIRWKGTDTGWKCTYLKAKMELAGGQVRDYTIVLDYNGRGKVATKKLSDVTVNTKDVNNDFSNALALADGGTSTDNLQTITVKFDVRDGGGGLNSSEGIISTKDDSYLVYNGNSFADDFTITIPVPASDEYLNIRWWGNNGFGGSIVNAKMKPVSSTVILDYRGDMNVATNNLYDVRIDNVIGEDGEPSSFYYEFEDAKNRAVID